MFTVEIYPNQSKMPWNRLEFVSKWVEMRPSLLSRNKIYWIPYCHYTKCIKIFICTTRVFSRRKHVHFSPHIYIATSAFWINNVVIYINKTTFLSLHCKSKPKVKVNILFSLYLFKPTILVYCKSKWTLLRPKVMETMLVNLSQVILLLH